MLSSWETRQCNAVYVPHLLLFQQLCGTKTQRQCPKSKCWRTQPQDNPSSCDSPAPPPSTFWSLPGCVVCRMLNTVFIHCTTDQSGGLDLYAWLVIAMPHATLLIQIILCGICVRSVGHYRLSSLTKGGRWLVNAQNHLSACCAHEGETGTD